MAQADLPAPLVPEDVDIAGLPAFMLDIERLFASELWACSTGDEFKAAVSLWGRAWQQRPAGSLPNDERVLAAFSGAGSRWRKVKAMALRGFVLCADNRYYHRVLCEDVMRAAKHKEARRERTSAATKARLAKSEDGSHPPSGGKKLNGNNKTAERNVDRNETRDDPRDESRNGVRHENRNEIVASATCASLRSPIDRTGQDSSREYTSGGSDPVPREPPPAWNTRANFDRVERRCREVLPASWVNDLVVSPMVKLEHEGLDFEAEIIPAILDLVASRRVPIRTWTTLANAVAERVTIQRETRTSQGLSAKPPAPSPPEETVDLGVHGRYPEATIRLMLERFRTHPGSWIEGCFGPPPGQPGCRVPPRLLIGEAA